MRIIYLHGWGERYNEELEKILSKFGDEVFFPTIDYQNNTNLISSLANEAYSKKVPTLIVGRLLGGYFAYHISNMIQFPSLLFDPLFFFKNGGEIKPNYGYDKNYDKMFIFSGKNEDMDIRRTLKFLKENDIKESEVKIYDDIKNIPLDLMEKEFSEFREKFKDFKIEEKQSKKKSKEDKITDTQIPLTLRDADIPDDSPF